MNTAIESQDNGLIELIFSAPNSLRWPVEEQVDEGPAVAASMSIRQFLRGKHDWPLLLPVKRVDTGLCWYLCAHSEGQLRALHEEMRAFVGPTFAEFPSMRSALDPSDPVEEALDARFTGRVLKLPVPAKYEAKASRQIDTYLTLLSERPAITANAVESFGQLRSRFDVALLAGNEGTAQEYLTALCARDLSAENRHFLRIRFHAALGHWDKIVAYPLLPSLLKLKLPPETYSDIFEALYQANLHKVEEAGSLDALLDAFQTRLFEPYAELFRTRRQVSRPSVLKGFICRELSLPTPDPKYCLALLAQLPEHAFPPAIDAAVRARCERLDSPDTQLAARAALEMEEFDRALALYQQLPRTTDSLCAMLRCAREIGDPGVAHAVLAMVSSVPGETQAEVVKRTPKMHQKVVELAAQVSGANGAATESAVKRLDWLKDEGETAEAYVERWREGAGSWDPEGLLSEVGCGKKAAAIIENLSLTEPDVFEQVFPLWYRLFIERMHAPDTRLVPVYLALMATLRVREVFAEDELTLVKRAVNCVLDCSVSAQLYEGMVSELQEILQTVGSFQYVDWALEVADLLATTSSRTSEGRVRFMSTAIATALKFVRRLSPVQRGLLLQLAVEAGIAVELPEPTTDGDQAEGTTAVTGRVAIYTLDAAAAERAKTILQRTYPQLRVDLNGDTVCTTALKQLARQADWFVFAWRCATHQAWFCVKAAVANSNTLCWASGNGAASLAQAVERQLCEHETSARQGH
jgi:hypothetical protein